MQKGKILYILSIMVLSPITHEKFLGYCLSKKESEKVHCNVLSKGLRCPVASVTSINSNARAQLS